MLIDKSREEVDAGVTWTAGIWTSKVSQKVGHRDNNFEIYSLYICIMVDGSVITGNTCLLSSLLIISMLYLSGKNYVIGRAADADLTIPVKVSCLSNHV